MAVRLKPARAPGFRDGPAASREGQPSPGCPMELTPSVACRRLTRSKQCFGWSRSARCVAARWFDRRRASDAESWSPVESRANQTTWSKVSLPPSGAPSQFQTLSRRAESLADRAIPADRSPSHTGGSSASPVPLGLRSFVHAVDLSGRAPSAGRTLSAVGVRPAAQPAAIQRCGGRARQSGEPSSPGTHRRSGTQPPWWN